MRTKRINGTQGGSGSKPKSVGSDGKINLKSSNVKKREKAVGSELKEGLGDLWRRCRLFRKSI